MRYTPAVLVSILYCPRLNLSASLPLRKGHSQ
jgi:hypothetical protein